MNRKELRSGAAGPGVDACAMARTLLLAAAIVYVAMISASFLLAPPGAPAPLDIHVTGYGPEEFAAYFKTLDRPAVLHATGPFRWLDYLFPPLLALGLLALFRCLARAGWPARLGQIVAVIYLVADLGENVLLDRMIRGWPSLPDTGLIVLAGSFTRLKFAALAVAVILLVVIMRRRRGAAGGKGA